MKVLGKHRMEMWKSRRLVLLAISFLVFIGIFSIQGAQVAPAADITLVGSAVGTGFATLTQSPVANLPSGLQSGHILLAWVVTDTNSTLSSITGWNLIGSLNGGFDTTAHLLYRVADGTEGASWTFTNLFTTTEQGLIVISAWDGVDNTNPINTSNSAQGIATSVSGPSITPDRDNCMIIQLLGCDPGGAYSATDDSDPDATEIYDARDSLFNYGYAAIQYYLQGTAGAIALDYTDLTSDTYVRFQVALNSCGTGSFSYRKPITVQSGQVSGGPHLNFPMLVSLTDNDLRTTAYGGDVTSSSGYDIIFRATDSTTCGGTAPCTLDHEIEKYVESTGELVAWVRVPSINNGTVIYMYYGNGCITSSTENPTGVWESSYKGVWHLHDDFEDSTINNHDGTNSGSTNYANAKIADGQDFDGINDSIQTNSSELKSANNFTISLWFNADATNFARHLVWEGENTGNGWGNGLSSNEQEMHLSFGRITGGVSQSNYLTFFLGDTDDAYGDIIQASYSFSDTTNWHHAVVVVTGLGTSPAAELFLDGTSVASDTGLTTRTNRDEWNADFRMGMPGATQRYHDGGLDEVRIATTNRSSGWILTEYNNQYAPSSFYASGNEENGVTVVELSSFTVIGEGSYVKVEWVTKTEVDNLGFNLYRSTERNGAYKKLNSALIPGLLSSVTGRKYSFTDTNVTEGRLYFYKLEDIDLNGTRTMHGPVCVDWDADGIPDDEDSDVAISESVSGQSSSGSGGNLTGYRGGTVTRVELQWLRAHKTKDGVMIEWRTGYEVDNLGFHVYREEDGELYRLTPELIAGSALLAGTGTPLTAGKHYTWWDTSISNQISDLRYWIEDIDLNGTRTMHGPVKIQPSSSRDQQSDPKQSKFLSELGKKLEESYEHFWRVQDLRERLSKRPLGVKSSAISSQPSAMSHEPSAIRSQSSSLSPQSSSLGTAMQRYLASRPAVKLSVKKDDWYWVSQPELVAAGLNPRINPRYLQLFVDGKEQPIRVAGDKDGRFDPQDAIEFYGVGLDTPSTDTRVYWLVAGTRPGKRIQVFKGQGGQVGASSFPYTEEKKERTIYFAALKNGDEDNLFGPIVASQRVDQILSVMHPDSSPPGDALLEVSLQGVTNASHCIKVLFNENEVGEVVFDGQSRGLTEFTIPSSSLIEGENLVTLIAQGGEMDISLLDNIRLTYWHTYTADLNVLKFTAEGGEQISLDGFGGPKIRVIDITDPEDVLKVIGKIESQDAGYSITFKVPDGGQRTLFAFSEERIRNYAGIAANQPSSWHQGRNGYDFVIIAHREFFEALKPLKDLRESQGLSVALIDIEDIYDEFNYGAKSPQALKDFLTLTKNQWYRAPRFVLLVGDASFDPRDHLGFGNLDYVPTKLIDTACLETASDDWFTDIDGDGLPDIAIGRIPVHPDGEVKTVISKIVGYEQSNPMKEALLVADRVGEKDLNFEGATEELASLIPAYIGVKEIFCSNFGSNAEAKAELLSSIDQSPLLVNYIGHGSVEIWRGNILTSDDADSLINGQGLSFFINMTCLNGFFHDLYTESLAEALLKAGQGGAIAVWASSGLTEPDRQALMNKELIRLLFNGSLTIGEATMRAKAATDDEDVRRTWILFGDPTTRLKY